MNSPISNTILSQADIGSRAMLFKLHRGGTHRRIRDKDAENLVKQTLGDEGQIVSRELFADKSSLLAQYQTLAGEMYSYHVKATLPFGDDASRLLPNTAYFDYTSTMQGYISRLEQLKQGILNSWNTLVTNDVTTRNARLIGQGKPANASANDYPTAAMMEQRLYVTWYPTPVSTSNDFRFELPESLKQSLDQQINELIDQAGRELYVRMLDPVSAFIGKLTKYTGDKGQRWHDSFVDNLNALSRDLAPLNVNNDPEVVRLLGEIDKVVKPYAFAPDVLKDDPHARDQVRAKLEALESQLKGYAL